MRLSNIQNLIILIIILLLFIFVIIVLSTQPTLPESLNPINISLSIASENGSTISPEFNLNSGGVLTSNDAVESGIDPQSVFFAIDKSFLETPLKEYFILDEKVDGYSKYSTLSYTGSTTIRVKAKVICEENSKNLDEMLKNQEITYKTSAQKYCDHFQPCCIIIIQQA